MKTPQPIQPILALLLFAVPVFSGPEVDRLLKEYGKIETATCQIRRTKEGAAGKIKFLSRVYYTNRNKIHAEKITPIKQRTIADGKSLYLHIEGTPKGFSRPIDELSEQMTISLKLIPGTAMDHLLRLKGLDETVLETSTEAAKRIGIQTERQYVVLLLDPKDRLTGIEFYKTAAMKDQTANYAYHDFTEVLPNVWIPFTHEANICNDEHPFKETVKIDRFVANQPIAESLFIPSSFFDKNIDFVDDFARIFAE